ncbi:hypothetical protein MB901379_00483 [Mycobacterium basiliense]|uniref:Uncharacterized protein n=1 Tax=Mycobacterium basiliense TaxID=2094119 RepID=A0A3S4BF71_9MYCO|nr:hypothetical protein MB901379_00483 [Mycobacterium basiliense]
MGYRRKRRTPAGPTKPVAEPPGWLSVYDPADWLPASVPPVGSTDWEATYWAAYADWQAAGREWLDKHDTPGLEAAMAMPDEPFDPAAEGLVSIGRRTDTREA